MLNNNEQSNKLLKNNSVIENNNILLNENLQKEYLYRIPLSHAQRRFWYLYCNKKNGYFTEKISIIFPYNLIKNYQLQKYINLIIMSKKILRSSISVNGVYNQIHSGTESFFALYENNNTIFTFDNEIIKITNEIPLRFCFFKLDKNEIIRFRARFHNILVDGKSIRYFIQKLIKLLNQTEIKISKQENEYFEYCLLEKKIISLNEFDETIQFWSNILKNYLNNNDLIFYKFSNNKKKNNNLTKIIEFIINNNELNSKINSTESIYYGIKKIAIKNNATIFCTMVSIFRILLYKLYGINEISLGIPIDNRFAFVDYSTTFKYDFSKTIGVFLNFCVSITRIDPKNMNGNEFIKQNSKNITDILKFSKFPFNLVIKNVRKNLKNKNINFENLFQIVVIQDTSIEDDLENYSKNIINKINNFKILKNSSKQIIENSEPQYQMMWHFIEEKKKKQLRIRIEYNQKYISDNVINTLIEKYNLLCIKILSQFNNNKQTFFIDSLSLLSSNNIAQLNKNFKNCFSDYPIMHPVDCVKSALKILPPNKFVVKDGYNLKIDAKTLYYLSQSFSLLLEPQISTLRTIESNDIIIAILHKKNINLISLILGIWLAGASVLPISNDWSEEKIYNTLNEFKNKIIFITDQDNFLNKWRYKLYMSNLVPKAYKIIENKIPKILFKNRNWWDILYLTFTSGSTGKPKIVVTEAHALMNHIMEYTKLFFYNYDSIVYQVVNYAFDIFFSDLLVSLINGSLLLLAKDEIPNLKELIKCTHAYIMPSYLSKINLKKNYLNFSNLKILQFGGEKISKKWLLKSIKLQLPTVQLFGLTETTIYSAYQFFCKLNTNIKHKKFIGKPFSNVFIFVVDKDKNIIPNNAISATGNLCISGVDVSRGYISMQKNSKFIKNLSNGFYYFLTNDLIKINKNENYQFLGRTDDIIKIRGNLIKPIEIERIILDLMPQIINCVVCEYNNKLFAFLQIKNNKKKSEIKSQLIKKLIKNYPMYIVPNEIIIISKFALNSNGKILKNNLINILKKKNYECKSINNLMLKNQITSEEINTICKIFAKNFKLNKLKVDENIFEKGADSLNIMMALQEIESKLNLIININDVFKYPTISSFLKTIKYLNKNSLNNNTFERLTLIFKSNKQIPISYNQEHLWFLHNFNLFNANDSYIIQLSIKFNEQPDLYFLTYALNFLIQSNVVLKTLIKSLSNLKESNKNDILYQQFLSGTESFICIFCNKNLNKYDYLIDISFEIPIKLIVNLNNFKIIQILFHHIAVDGKSLILIFKKLVNFYNKKMSTNKSINDKFKYAEFALDQKSKSFTNELNYWKDQLSSVKNIIFYNNVNLNKNFFKNKSKILKSKLQITTNLLNNFKIKYSCTLTQLFIATYLVTLYNEIPNEKIVIGTPFENRTMSNINVIGYFATMHAICFSMNKYINIDLFIKHVKEQIIDASNYAHTPFELIVKELQPKRQLGFNPIFQRVFSYEKNETLNNFKNIINFKNNLNATFKEKNSKFTKFSQYWKITDLSTNDSINNNLFYLTVEYNKYLFSKETIKNTINNFQLILNNFLNEQITKFPILNKNIINTTFLNDLNILKKKINNIWCKVLQINIVNNDDNFFEIGGHSFLANRICAIINDELKQNIKLIDLFKVLKFLY